MCHKNPKPREEKPLLLHGNQAKIDQLDHSGQEYATNALTQYDVPIGTTWKEETDQAVEDAKRRVDENEK